METALQVDQEAAAAAPRRSVVLPLLAAVLVMLSFLTLPRAATDLDLDSDASLGEVLGYAHQQGLQFGTDFVSTYGPLGYVIFVYFSPRTAGTCMVIGSVFCFVAAAGLCLVAWRVRLVWGCALVGAFLFVATNVEARADLVMDAGLLCWGLLCFVESGRRLSCSAAAFVALAAFNALAKSSALFMVGPSLILVASDLAVRGRARLGLGMVGGFGAALALGWMAAGQDLSHLGAHLINALAIVQGYNQTLGWEALSLAIESGLVLIGLALGMLIIRALTAFKVQGPRGWWRRLLLFAWLCSFLLPIWKHGFVRGDTGHLVYFFGFIPVLALALEILPSEAGAPRRWTRMLQIACCCLALFTVQSLVFAPASRSLTQPFRFLAYHARCLLRPGEYLASMNSVIGTNRSRARLPVLSKIIGRASVDVFGQRQIYALLNGLNYRPRPAFQSYSACNARLMSLNEQFYLSEQAPEFVMFDLAPIDRKFPPLEDARVLRHLLANYEPAGAEGGFLLLKRKSSHAPQLTLLREGVAHLGERIDLRGLGEAQLWLEIGMNPTLLGRLRQFFLRPAPVRLAAWRQGVKGLLAQRRAPAAMLAAGFVASPLVLSTQDVTDFYAGKDPARPDSYSVVLQPEDRRFWQEAVPYRIYQIARSDGH
jgi:hypothetical protein